MYAGTNKFMHFEAKNRGGAIIRASAIIGTYNGTLNCHTKYFSQQ